jgi:hypothetical protein
MTTPRPRRDHVLAVLSSYLPALGALGLRGTIFNEQGPPPRCPEHA